MARLTIMLESAAIAAWLAASTLGRVDAPIRAARLASVERSVSAPDTYVRELQRRALVHRSDPDIPCSGANRTGFATVVARQLNAELDAASYAERRAFPEQLYFAAGDESASDQVFSTAAWDLLATAVCRSAGILESVSRSAMRTEYSELFHYAPAALDYAALLSGQWCGPFDDLRLFQDFIVVDRKAYAADYSLEVDPDSEAQNLVVNYAMPHRAIFRLRYQPRRDVLVRFYASIDRHHQVYKRCADGRRNDDAEPGGIG